MGTERTYSTKPNTDTPSTTNTAPGQRAAAVVCCCCGVLRTALVQASGIDCSLLDVGADSLCALQLTAGST